MIIDQLPFLAASGFALARSFAVLIVDIIDGADNANRNYEEPQDAEENVWRCGLLVNRHQFRLKRQCRISYTDVYKVPCELHFSNVNLAFQIYKMDCKIMRQSRDLTISPHVAAIEKNGSDKQQLIDGEIRYIPGITGG